MARLPVEHSVRAEVRFAGFTSDTYTLQRNGWQIAVEEDFHNYCEESTMALRNDKLGVVAYGRCRDYRRMLLNSRERRFASDYESYPLTYVIEQMGRGVILRTENPSLHMRSFSLIDATPNVMMMEEYDLYNLPAFAKAEAPHKAEELIVDPADVSAMLDMIRKQQAPTQREIRERVRRRELIPVQHATILTFPQAA
jgi:hypothetical protein